LRLDFEGGTRELSGAPTVDVTPSAFDIDKNPVTTGISTYLGRFHNGDETGTLIALFQDSGGRQLGKIETKPYLDKELLKAEIDSTGLVLGEASGPVPASTNKDSVHRECLPGRSWPRGNSATISDSAIIFLRSQQAATAPALDCAALHS
jgi:hypothetical protein